ncbi:MAG: LL-diaminopimelate aminotransferase [Clostridiaceae bacterium]|nr:LL-diaminopimelate aminotransferase [Clostridiaceae bacterium]
MSYIDNLIAERLGGINFGKDTKIYKFEKIKRAKRAAKKMHPEVELIDMGVGEPDWAADANVVKTLSEEAGKPENRWYADNGIEEFQQAACKYLEDVYGVKGLDPLKNIIHGIGSKPILAMLPSCLINPGDYVLMTVPGYGVLGTHTEYLGGKVYNLELKEEKGYLPDFSDIPTEILKKAKMLYINYPNNPTGQVATKEFFEEVVAFAKKNNILVVHDAAYASLTYDGYKPLSFLSVDGAIDVGVEIHSLSKAFNMTGWRIAFIAGNEKVVKAYGVVKDNSDSGQFRAIQKAGIYALNHPEITEKTIKKYSRRFDLLVKALREVGFDAKKPKGTFYCYVKAPIGAEGVTFENAEDAAEYLIKNALISTVPWDNVGSYLRFSVTFEASEEEEVKVIQELENRLKSLNLVFENKIR